MSVRPDDSLHCQGRLGWSQKSLPRCTLSRSCTSASSSVATDTRLRPREHGWNTVLARAKAWACAGRYQSEAALHAQQGLYGQLAALEHQLTEAREQGDDLREQDLQRQLDFLRRQLAGQGPGPSSGLSGTRGFSQGMTQITADQDRPEATLRSGDPQRQPPQVVDC